MWIKHKLHGGEGSWKPAKGGYPEHSENAIIPVHELSIRSRMKLDEKQ